MKTRLTAPLMLAALGIAVLGSAANADVSLFGGYWENVARAASQNDAARVRSILADDGNPNQTDAEARTGLHYAAMNGNPTITSQEHNGRGSRGQSTRRTRKWTAAVALKAAISPAPRVSQARRPKRSTIAAAAFIPSTSIQRSRG